MGFECTSTKNVVYGVSNDFSNPMNFYLDEVTLSGTDGASRKNMVKACNNRVIWSQSLIIAPSLNLPKQLVPFNENIPKSIIFFCAFWCFVICFDVVVLALFCCR